MWKNFNKSNEKCFFYWNSIEPTINCRLLAVSHVFWIMDQCVVFARILIALWILCNIRAVAAMKVRMVVLAEADRADRHFWRCIVGRTCFVYKQFSINECALIATTTNGIKWMEKFNVLDRPDDAIEFPIVTSFARRIFSENQLRCYNLAGVQICNADGGCQRKCSFFFFNYRCTTVTSMHLISLWEKTETILRWIDSTREKYTFNLEAFPKYQHLIW